MTTNTSPPPPLPHSFHSADELLITEMIFNGMFNELTVSQSVALMSCFCFDEKTNDMPKLRDELSGALRQMQVRGSGLGLEGVGCFKFGKNVYRGLMIIHSKGLPTQLRFSCAALHSITMRQNISSIFSSYFACTVQSRLAYSPA